MKRLKIGDKAIQLEAVQTSSLCKNSKGLKKDITSWNRDNFDKLEAQKGRLLED